MRFWRQVRAACKGIWIVAALATTAAAQNAMVRTASPSMPSAPPTQIRMFIPTGLNASYRTGSRSGAENGGAPWVGDTTASAAVFYPTTRMAYGNYADAARAEYAAMTTSTGSSSLATTGGVTQTLHMGSMNATFGMGGGDVQLQQSGLISLAQAAAMAEASMDLSDARHRFGLRVQGRSISSQPLFLSAAYANQLKLVLTAKPMLTAYWHF